MSIQTVDTNYFIQKYSAKYESFKYKNFNYWVNNQLIPASKDEDGTYVYLKAHEPLIDHAVDYMMTTKNPTIKKAMKDLQAHGFELVMQEVDTVTKNAASKEEKEKIEQQLNSPIDVKMEHALHALTTLHQLPDEVKTMIEQSTGNRFSEILDTLDIVFDLKETVNELVDHTNDIKQQLLDQTALQIPSTLSEDLKETLVEEIKVMNKDIAVEMGRLYQEQNKRLRLLEQFVGKVATLSKLTNPFAIPLINEANRLLLDPTTASAELPIHKPIQEEKEQD